VKAVAGIFVLTAVATASVLTGAPAGPPQPVAMLPDVGAAVVQIVTIRTRTGVRTRHGSAFYVDASGHLLTCLHVVDQTRRRSSSSASCVPTWRGRPAAWQGRSAVAMGSPSR